MKKILIILIALLLIPSVSPAAPPSAPQGGLEAASTTVAGKIEIATAAETNTGTDATRAVSPDAIEDWTGSAQITTVGTLASGDIPGSLLSGTIAFSSFVGNNQISTTGRTNGGIHAIEHTAATYTVGTTDAYDSYGTYHYNSDDDAFALTLIAGVASSAAQQSGCLEQGKAVVTGSSTLTLVPASGDILVKDGVACTANQTLVSGGTVADKICWVGRNVDDITITSYRGTWTCTAP